AGEGDRAAFAVARRRVPGGRFAGRGAAIVVDGASALGRDQAQGDSAVAAAGRFVDVGAGVGVGAEQVVFGGEVDGGAVDGHPVVEGAGNRTRSEVGGVRRAADMHVEVEVVVALGIGRDLLAGEDVRAVFGDVELGDPVAIPRRVARPAALQAGQRVARGIGGDHLGGARAQVAVVDRDVAGAVVATRLELRRRAEDEVTAIGREVLLDQSV